MFLPTAGDRSIRNGESAGRTTASALQRRAVDAQHMAVHRGRHGVSARTQMRDGKPRIHLPRTEGKNPIAACIEAQRTIDKKIVIGVMAAAQDQWLARA